MLTSYSSLLFCRAHSLARTSSYLLLALTNLGLFSFSPTATAQTSATSALSAARPPPLEHWQLLSVVRSEATAAALQTLPVLVEGGTVERMHLQVRAGDRQLLDTRGIPYEILAHDLAATRPREDLGRDVEYHSSAEVSARMRELAELYPLIARVVDLGRSWQGRELTGMLISDQPWIRELDEPSLRVLGTHHGDEWSAMEVGLDLIEALLANYDSNQEVAAMVDHAELWFVPVVNPDGVAAYTRRNSRGVDLNRNYSYLWQSGAYSGEEPFSERETSAIRALSMTRSFSHGLSLHSGASNLGWVWNHTTEPAPDAAFMEGLCEDYLEATEQPGFWITNGAQWYVTFGDTNDWSYGVRGGHDYTLEVSVERSPDPELLEELLAFHRWPSLDFLSAGFRSGMRGRITDAQGQPLEAEVLVGGLDSATFSDPETGSFARPLLPGEYQLTVSAPGHLSETINAAVTEDESTQLSIQLTNADLVEIEGTNGLEANIEVISEATICGTDLVSRLDSDGQIMAMRPGLGGPFELSWRPSQETSNSCVVLTVEPQAIGEARQREGEWHLLFTEPNGEIIAVLHLGLVLVASEPGFDLDALSLSGPADTLVVTVSGSDLPQGAAIRLIGPAGERALPTARLTDDTGEQISARFDASAWDDGLWSLRVFGRGHWAALSGALSSENGVVSVVKNAGPPPGPLPGPNLPKGPTPEDDDRNELNEEEEASSDSGCSCATGTLFGPPSAGLMLALALMIGYFRRSHSSDHTTWSPAVPELKYLSFLLPALLIASITGCEFPKEDEMTFTEAVKAVYTPCDRDEIKLNTAAKGLQLVFEACGSNNFFHFGWAPTGTTLHYQTTQGLWVLKDTGENYPLRVGIPRADSAWLNDDLLAYPDANGRQIGIYTVATHVLYLLEIDHSEPEQLAHGKGADDVLYLAADVPGGVKDIHRLKANSGLTDKAFSWLTEGVENFTYQRDTDTVCYRALGGTEVVCARGEDGKVLRRVKNRKRGVLSVDGRYLVTEGDGAAVPNFPDLKPGETVPDYLDMETIPPALWITDMESGEELLWKGLHGTDFEWYEATPYFGSFVLWGLDGKELNSNVTLVDLRHFLESKGWSPPLGRDGKQLNAQPRGRSGRLD